MGSIILIIIGPFFNIQITVLVILRFPFIVNYFRMTFFDICIITLFLFVSNFFQISLTNFSSLYIIKVGNEIHVSGCQRIDKPFVGQKQNGLFFIAYVVKYKR